MQDVEKVYGEYLKQMRVEFVDEAEDNLDAIESILENFRSGSEDPHEALIKIKRFVHSIKGSSGVADFPLVTIITHRLEDYFSNLTEIEIENANDIQIYLDKVREFSRVEIDQKSISSSDLVSELPMKRIVGLEPEIQKKTRKIEALMVIKEKMAGLIFERELRHEGLRVTTIRNSFDAIQMIVRTRPDLVVVSGIIDVLSGVDVACAVKAMPTTSDIKVCILTSFESGHHDLDGLPDDVLLIHKNTLREDLEKLLGENI